ncbi:MAG TPA: hypothetical protein VGL56_09440 [Fimbriimonadaceae bacterium]|jgi:hypothetical protein
MKRLRGLTFSEIAFEIAGALDRAGVHAVLSGGSAATLYAPEAYQTADFDFVLLEQSQAATRERLSDELAEIGFFPAKARGTYSNSEIPFTLELLPGPLAVGSEVLTEWETLVSGDQVLRILRPEDSIKDRLAAAIHWNDLSSAKQAAYVASVKPVNLDEIKHWCASEGGQRTFESFASFLRL